MKQLLNRPLLLGFLLSLPLWIVLGNFIVALMVALLLSFLLSMYTALRTLQGRDTSPEDAVDGAHAKDAGASGDDTPEKPE